MRVLMIGMEWLPNRTGGLNRYFYEEAHALPRFGVTGSALVMAKRPEQTAPMTLKAMADEGASLMARWRGLDRVVQEELREGTAVLNPHFALYGYRCLRHLKSGANGAVSMVVNFQGPWSEEMRIESAQGKTRLPKSLERLRIRMARRQELAVYHRAARLIVLSESFRQLLLERYGVPAERVRVIPGGFEAKTYLSAPPRAEARQYLGWSPDRPILFCLRRLARRMGLENLIEAMRTVTRAHPNVLLLIGGKGPIADELQARIDRHALGQNVKLLGFVADETLPLAYAAANLSVVPTVALEGFGLITVESLASGTPVIGTPVGGTREILEPLEARLLSESAEPDALAHLIIEALAGRLSLPNRETCRRYVLRYDWQETAPRIRSVFAEVTPALAAERLSPSAER